MTCKLKTPSKHEAGVLMSRVYFSSIITTHHGSKILHHSDCPALLMYFCHAFNAILWRQTAAPFTKSPLDLKRVRAMHHYMVFVHITHCKPIPHSLPLRDISPRGLTSSDGCVVAPQFSCPQWSNFCIWRCYFISLEPSVC